MFVPPAAIRSSGPGLVRHVRTFEDLALPSQAGEHRKCPAVVRLQLQHFAKTRSSVIKVALQLIRDAKTVMCAGQPRLQVDGLTVIVNGESGWIVVATVVREVGVGQGPAWAGQ